MSKRTLCLIFTISILNSVYSQEKKSPQDTFLEAEFFFMQEDYSDALTSYLQLYEKNRENANLAYCIGVCYLNIPGKKNLSIDYLEAATKKMSAKRKEGTIEEKASSYNTLYELARAYRINNMFDKSKETFLKYASTLNPKDKENVDFINHEVQVCEMAKSLITRPVAFTDENIGELFNDEKANFNPVISADGKSFAFMVSLKFYDAIMFSRLNDGKWSTPVNISPDIQADGDLFISCLSADGRALYLSKDDNDNSDIYISTFDGTVWNKLRKLNKNINTKYWESHGSVSDDGDQLIFASDRPGGYGGLDLYISKKINGDWGPAVNLGPEVNTLFNEDRPFLINNGKSLFFSSQGHENIGGYDLFRSDIQSNGKWEKPKNLGFPFNTPDDNIYFMPASDGKSGYYSTFKTTGGFGKEDIYKVTFK